ncbi:Tyrosine-protein phosphatase pmp1 [Cytospora mali]|uniref:protein-tyrosine-phosphatase n=1 Tax=Cytospora mali TaxID=578113 RepID=A0A194VN66_CYTMA|nr:Tyrosine-protein phosphatase pmp1 [Valsa mali]
MSTTASRRFFEEQIPPFMAVFDLDQAMQDQDTVTVVDPKMMEIESNCNPKLSSDPSQLLQPPAIPPSHQHRDSTSTHTTESADSSPTTTVSCTDSSSFSDPSPSSSPDSPVNLVPLNAFPSTTFGALPSMATLTVSEPGHHRLRRPMTSPAPRRPRNMKGLSIQPPFANSAASSSLASEPSSPSFIKPKIPAMKRKPSQLSLKTNSDDLAGRPILEAPQSPSVPALAQRRALKHSMSSPHMLSGLKSSTFGPAGGMTFPTVFERNESGLSSFLRPAKPPSCHSDDAIMEEDSPIRSQMANRAAFDVEPYHEKETNEDKKAPGYPDGPIAIYGDNVYLYLEPTAEEASRFDVVINVAREVANPFETTSGRDEYMQDMSPVPDTALTNCSFSTAFEYMPDDITPTTPKAMLSPNRPEYIHMPWDHNTDISQDLMYLCETIERKTLAGKKVLVHCQQGASRSASLIIAYGLYQNPEMSVNDAYYAAQSKSKWISPNMRLMYCLQDFQKEVSKKRLSPNPVYKPRSGRSPSKHRMTLSVDAIDVPKEPRTAPLPEEDSSSRNESQAKSQLRARGHSTPEQISPGPSSAPSSLAWAQGEDESDPGRFGRFNYSEIFTAPTPVEENASSGFGSFSSSSGPFSNPPPSPGFGPSLADSFSQPPPSPGFGAHRFGGQGSFGFSPLNLGSLSRRGSREPPASVERPTQALNSLPEEAALRSPRAETITHNAVHRSIAGMRFVEVPPTPTDRFFSRQIPEDKLFSPRESTFPRDTFNPFARKVPDPRSPPTKGEAPIIRSIDEFI